MFKKVGEIAKEYRPGSVALIILGVIVFLSIITIVRMFGGGFKAKVVYENDTKGVVAEQKKERVKEAVLTVLSDPNAKYAERVREGSALALGLSWFVVNEKANGREYAVSGLMREFDKSEIKPPFCEVLLPDREVSYGMVKCIAGLYYLRYRAKPVSIEVLSGDEDSTAGGTSFVIRVPDSTGAAREVKAGERGIDAGSFSTIYQSPEAGNYFIPPPFSDAKIFDNTGWKASVVRQPEFSQKRLDELKEFLDRAN